MPTLVKDVLYRVSTALGDTSPQFIDHPERDMVDWLNDGQQAIAKFLPFSVARTDAVKLQPGIGQSIARVPADRILPGDGSTPRDTFGIRLADVLRNLGDDGATPGAAIYLVAREDLDGFDRNWTKTTGTEICQFMFDPRTPRAFYVQPGVAAGADVWVEISWEANPSQIPNTGTPGMELYAASGSSTETISLPDEFVADLVLYCLARAGNPAAEQSFIASINAQAKVATGENPNLKTLPLAPSPPAQAS